MEKKIVIKLSSVNPFQTLWAVEFHHGGPEGLVNAIGFPTTTEPHELVSNITVAVFEIFIREFLGVKDVKRFKEEMGIKGKHLEPTDPNVREALDHVQKEIKVDSTMEEINGENKALN